MVNEKDMTEEEYLADYNMQDYPSIAGTVDLAIFTIRNNQLSVLLIKRGGHPHMGKWALPGGFVNVNESLDEAANRELLEETNLTMNDGYLEQLKTYGNPGRDPRGYVISTSYVALVPHADIPEAGDDADEARFFAVDEVLTEFDLAFDHKTIIQDGLERVRSKIEYAPVAHHFLDDETFTISELRTVYEIVWGESIVPSNFRRKIQSVPNFLESVENKRSSKIEGGRESQLYRAGSADEIFPPLRRG